jgi:hypothetical protein
MLSGTATAPAILLVLAVAVVGVLHTAVPDHWVPITLIARQHGWSRGETARAALTAGTGHVASTLIIAVVVWFAGVAFATRFGNAVDTTASIALVLFGGWIAVGAWRELRRGSRHRHSHSGLLGHHHHDGHDDRHGQAPGAGIHGTELHQVDTGCGVAELSIFEDGVPPRFRFAGPTLDQVRVETIRASGARQLFSFVNRGGFWESQDEIPEPHGFRVKLMLRHGSHDRSYDVEFVEHVHGPHGHNHEAVDDPLYAPLGGGVAVLTRHAHAHRHGGTTHTHWHDHGAETAHEVSLDAEAVPLHRHKHRTSVRVALLVVMAIVFAASTVVTYLILCLYSTARLQRVKLGPLERYGEVISGVFISLVGVVFWLWPVT